MSKKGTTGRKGKHWAQRVREVVVGRSSNGSFNVCIEGGAENGEFGNIGNFKPDKVKYKQGKLHVSDIILEVNDVTIAGYTLPDVVTLIKKTGEVLRMRVVKPGKKGLARSDSPLYRIIHLTIAPIASLCVSAVRLRSQYLMFG